MQPPAEHVHWLFATGVLLIGMLLLAEAIVGTEVWRKRKWRAYLWPSLVFGLGVFMWPVMVFFTNSTIHMLAHSSWAQAMMVAGAAELGLVSGKLKSEHWKLAVPVALAVSGAAFLIHEANPWLYSRSAFVHHVVRVDAPDRRAVPARCGVQDALAAVQSGVRVRRRRRLRSRSTPPVTSRPCSGTSSPTAGVAHR